MKNLMLFLILFTLSPLSLLSQVYYENANIYNLIRQKEIEKLNLNDRYSSIVGTPYDCDEFQEGYFITRSNRKYSDIKLRFNIYNSIIEVKNDSGIYALTIPELFNFFVIGDKKYKYSPYTVNKKVHKGYFYVIAEGDKAQLFHKERVIYKKPTQPGAYKVAEPAKFKRTKGEYYIKVGTREAQIVGGKKDLVAILSRDVEDFIKKNKIKAWKKSDLIELIEHYNSM